MNGKNKKTNNTFVRINAVPLPDAKKALSTDQYVFDEESSELKDFLRTKKYVPTLPKAAALLYTNMYILLIDFPNNEVRIDIYPKRGNEIIYQIFWNPIANTHRFYCTLDNGLSEHRGVPLNYGNSTLENFIRTVDSIIQKNQKTTSGLALNIIDTVRLFLYIFENHSNYITQARKKKQKNIICLTKFFDDYQIVQGYMTKDATQVAPYLRRKRSQ